MPTPPLLHLIIVFFLLLIIILFVTIILLIIILRLLPSVDSSRLENDKSRQMGYAGEIYRTLNNLLIDDLRMSVWAECKKAIK